MLVPLDVVKGENRAITGRQLPYSLIERNAIHNRHGVRVFRPLDDLDGYLALFGRLLEPHAALPKMHEHLIDRQAMQPGRKRRFATEAAYLPEELDKDFLRQVLGFSNVLRHAQTQRIYAAIMTLVKLLEGRPVALSGSLRQFVIRSSRCLRFAFSHVFSRFEGDLNGAFFSTRRAPPRQRPITPCLLPTAYCLLCLVSDHRRAVTSREETSHR